MRPAIQSLVDNRLPEFGGPYAALLGDHPSRYSKSPRVWNATLRELGMSAAYVAMDVSGGHLPALVSELRNDPDFAGGNVTLPHKVAILPLLDQVEAEARAIGAVNTLARAPDGRLEGFNTDAPAGLEALSLEAPDGPGALCPSPQGLRVLMLGAGGAARALAFGLAPAIGRLGRLWIVNRNEAKAAQLARAVNESVGIAEALPGERLAGAAVSADLILNATSIGQSGARVTFRGRTIDLEVFSPLARLDLDVAVSDDDGLRRAIQANQAESRRILETVPGETAIWDIIYAPAETVLLRQARETGHRGMNGRSMLVRQAAASFFRHVFRPWLESNGLLTDETYRRILLTMMREW